MSAAADGFDHLAALLAPKDNQAPDRPQVFYLALAPHLFADTAKCLAAAGLNHPQARLV